MFITRLVNKSKKVFLLKTKVYICTMNGKTIRAIIDNRGIKHVWLSERLGVSKTLLSLWLSEEREMPKDYKIQIADILNIPISELV